MTLRRLLTIADFQKIAKERNGECLSTTYVNSRGKLLFCCAAGHQKGRSKGCEEGIAAVEKQFMNIYLTGGGEMGAREILGEAIAEARKVNQ